MTKFISLLGFLLSFILCATAQNSNSLKMEIEAQTGVTSSANVPFWMRSNQFGSVPIEGASVSGLARIHKDYQSDSVKKRVFDWGFGFEGRGNVGKRSEFLLIEGYAKARIAMFQLKAGRTRDLQGLMDTTLSTGSFIQSGTALGIPKIEISIPEFYRLPVLDGVLSLKGNFAHGWLGPVNIYNNENFIEKSYFHQKSLWGRLGKAHWRTRIYAGFSHNVVWGNEKKWIGYFPFNDWETYKYILFGKVFNDSKVGNHGGTIDVRAEYDFAKITFAAYRQNFYDVGALYHLANVQDGLQGISITNREKNSTRIRWKRLLVEYLYTKNQAGEEWSKPTPTGNENYMNHYLYQQGWSYKSIGLGTPFITRHIDTRDDLPYKEDGRGEYFSNNRVAAFHVGALLGIDRWDITTKVSYSKNYGTHLTKKDFPGVSQIAAFVEVMHPFKSGMKVGIIGAFDQGKLLNNSSGLLFRVVKQL